MRDYRKVVKPMGERKAHADGVQEGLARCIRYMRESIAAKSISGYQAALMIERSMLEFEPAEVRARQRFVEQLRGNG